MKKIAFIVQRFGPEINGGAEVHCMQLAVKLSAYYDVEVLTTCAFDYSYWADHYPEGVSKVNGLTVRRFKVSQLRDGHAMGRLEKKANMRNDSPKKKGWKAFVRRLLWGNGKGTDKDYTDWILAQGPTTPDLINYLKKNEQEYDALIFFTYLYYPTVYGIGTNPGKTILIPTAHDEWAIRMPVFKPVFSLPACIMYNTLAERRMVHQLFKNEGVYSGIAGVGVDVPANLPDVNMKQKMKINSDYILYVGRVDVYKITDEDFNFFLKYRRETKKNIKLVLVGKLQREVPKNKNIISLGFVDEATKFNLIRQALLLFQPSKYESLSMVVLEAFMMEKPVLVHADCEVMKDHIQLSGGGYYYRDYAEFKNALDVLVDDKQANSSMGKAGKQYVEANYQWENIISKFRYVIEERLKPKEALVKQQTE